MLMVIWLLFALGQMKSAMSQDGVGLVLCTTLIHLISSATMITIETAMILPERKTDVSLEQSSPIPHSCLITDNLTEALLFLSHFIGDIHQPLHVGFTGDGGGKSIIVHWYKRKANLHHVWDDVIIDSALQKFYNMNLAAMVETLQTNIVGNWSADIPLWEACESNQTVCPNLYASESIRLACMFAYRKATPGSTLGDEYFLTRLPVVEKRLAQGGVRLAATLNRIFKSTSHHPFQLISDSR